MWKENLYQPVEVLVRRHRKFPIGEHQHSFFEMVYVRSGRGSFYVCEEGARTQQTDYRARSLFLLPPDTVHCFTTAAESEYLFIRFTDRYATDYIGRQVGLALHGAAGACRIDLSGRDARTADTLFGFIRAELAAGRGCTELLVRQWLNSILVLVADHCLGREGTPPEAAGDDDRAAHMLQYIQQHIRQPELLRAEALGARFHLAASYVGPCFRRRFGEELRHYITRSRIRAVEKLLTETSLTVKEIAAETGYADSSHLVKAFRRHCGLTPLAFRKTRPNVPQSDAAPS